MHSNIRLAYGNMLPSINPRVKCSSTKRDSLEPESRHQVSRLEVYNLTRLFNTSTCESNNERSAFPRDAFEAIFPKSVTRMRRNINALASNHANRVVDNIHALVTSKPHYFFLPTWFRIIDGMIRPTILTCYIQFGL